MTFKARLFESYWFQNLLFFSSGLDLIPLKSMAKVQHWKKNPLEHNVAVQNKQVETVVRVPAHMITFGLRVHICVCIDSYMHSHVHTSVYGHCGWRINETDFLIWDFRHVGLISSWREVFRGTCWPCCDLLWVKRISLQDLNTKDVFFCNRGRKIIISLHQVPALGTPDSWHR